MQRAPDTTERSIPAGWYCIASLNELPADVPITKAYFGGQLCLEHLEGTWEACLTIGNGAPQALHVHKALGALWAWYPGQQQGSAIPGYELPILRFELGAWQFAFSSPILVNVPLMRPLCDYFDHWHTRQIHQIPIRNAVTWFENARCGVSWIADIYPLHHRAGLVPYLGWRVPSRSKVTLFGLSLAIDELSHLGLHLVNIQSVTPIDAQCLEMRPAIGVPHRKHRKWIARLLSRRILQTTLEEIERDKCYWAACGHQTLERDEESNRDMALFAQWVRALA